MGSYHGIILRDHIKGSYYGIILQDNITELYNGIILRNHITDSYYGIVLRNNLCEKEPRVAQDILGDPLGSQDPLGTLLGPTSVKPAVAGTLPKKIP